MHVSTTEMVIKRCITLHNMCIEERTAEELEDEVASGEVLVGGGVNPMWGPLVRLTGQSVVLAGVGSIAVVCEMARLIENEAK